MPRNDWSPKREREYKHIKDSLLERGKGEKLAEEIAARTVNKDRAQHGETQEASRSTLDDISASRRGGLHSHSGAAGRTFDQLYNEAKAHGVKGRSSMTKAQLEAALRR